MEGHEPYGSHVASKQRNGKEKTKPLAVKNKVWCRTNEVPHGIVHPEL